MQHAASSTSRPGRLCADKQLAWSEICPQCWPSKCPHCGEDRFGGDESLHYTLSCFTTETKRYPDSKCSAFVKTYFFKSTALASKVA